MKVVAALVILVFLTGILWWSFDGDEVGTSEQSPSLIKNEDKSDPVVPEVRLIAGNPFITDYGKEGGTTASDLESLRDIVGDCQLLLKDFDRYHLPGNPGITRFLQGGNPDRFVWIPLGHRLVNDEGELLDRHGTPIFFHRLSGMRFEYRSAGPDKEHWTDDDVVVK